MSKEVGFFCCNTDYPDRYVSQGFVVGPCQPTAWKSAKEIAGDGFVGIYTPLLDSKEYVAKYRSITGMPVPDRRSTIFPGLCYEIEQ